MFYCFLDDSIYEEFPPTHLALDDSKAEGLLCASDYKTFNVELLEKAYPLGIFPWSGENKQQMVFWFFPPKRPVFRVQSWKAPRSLKRVVKSYQNKDIEFSINQHFSAVIEGCADREETWITDKLKEALLELRKRGKSFSFEILQKGELIGGLYGVAIFPLFFAESMFSRRSGGSKMAFYGMMNYLKERGFTLVDAQVPSEHLQLLGSEILTYDEFQKHLNKL
jgi:leucyl/phenylalanyl-tRNA--protein transferase